MRSILEELWHGNVCAAFSLQMKKSSRRRPSIATRQERVLIGLSSVNKKTQPFWLCFFVHGGKGIRTLVGVSPNGFQDRLVMTTSISLRIYKAIRRGTPSSRVRCNNTTKKCFCQGLSYYIDGKDVQFLDLIFVNYTYSRYLFACSRLIIHVFLHLDDCIVQ